MKVMLQLLCINLFLFVSWPTDAESDGSSEIGRQQRVMIIGNNNVFEVGCCILSVDIIFTFVSLPSVL